MSRILSLTRLAPMPLVLSSLALSSLALPSLALSSLALQAPAYAQADNYPDRAVTIILPASAGGGSDTITRTMAAKLSEIWGQPVLVDNRPGAGGVIGTDEVAKAKPDGYTILSGFSEHAWMQYFANKPPFDMNENFTPISLVGRLPNVVAVNADVPAKDLSELITLLKDKPGQYNFGSGGIGSTLHLFGLLFKNQAGVDIVHVPYKGANESNLAMISGQIQMAFPTALSIAPHAQAGKARVLALSADDRLPSLPDVPTVAEAGMPDFRISISYWWFAPAGTPKEIVDKIHAGLIEAGNSPEVRERLNGIGVEIVVSSPEELGETFKAEQARWGKIIEDENITFQ